MTEDAVVERLDTLISLFRLAFKEALEAGTEALLRDPVVRAVLDAVEGGWVAAGEVRKRAANASSQSERTVLRRISELVDIGALAQDGSGPSSRYRSTGLLR